jgi:hypothetical protein
MQQLNLSDKDLLRKTETLVLNEKKFTIQIIEHLQEIQRRKAFLECDCSSLFVYCTKILKYSGAEAHHRIYAMKLTRKNPDAKNKIAPGRLSLTNAAKIGAHIEKNKIKEASAVAELVNKLEGKTTREAETILFDLMPNGAIKMVTIKIEIHTHEKFELYRKKFGSYTDEEIMQRLLDQAISGDVPVPEKNISSKVPEQNVTCVNNSRYIPIKVRAQVTSRAMGQCEMVSRETNIRCLEKRSLEFDHIKPFTLGGSNDYQNIRLLCRNCNQRQAFLIFGDEYQMHKRAS